MEPITAAFLANALGDVVVQKGLESAIRLFVDASWRNELATRVSREAGVPAAREPLQRWLSRKETMDLLVSPKVAETYGRLHETLVKELTDQWLSRVGPLQEDVPMDAIAEALLLLTMRDYIASLDPSAAVQVSDERARFRHLEIQEQLRRVEALLAAGDPFEDQVRKLPPLSQRSLRTLHKVDPRRAAAVVRLVSDARQAPVDAIREQTRGTPTDLVKDAPPEFWLALADLASVYGARDVEALALERAATGGAAGRAQLLARAALALVAVGDRKGADDRLAEAKSVAPSDRFVEFVSATVDEDTDAVLKASEGLPSFVQGVPVGLMRALGLASKGLIDDAIDLLRQIKSGEPESTSIQMWLANLLLTKAHESHGDEARRLRTEALELARQSRDLRRRWRGPSAECVEVMARAAVAMGDMRLAYAICVTEGEATPEEAQAAAVREILVTLLLDRRDLQRAAQVADQIDSPFHQLLARGALAADSGRRDEAESHLRHALELARHEGERVDVIRHMATAGIWPLPDFDSIRQRDPESAAILEASSFLVRDDPRTAISALRPYRRSNSRVASLLASAYQKAGNLDDAINELQDAATYFREPELSARAALILGEAGRNDQAFTIASQVAYELPADSLLLPKIRVLLFNGLGARRDWAGAEEQARRLLETDPTSSEAGWALAISLTNQSRLEEAWSEINERRLTPGKVEQAKVWVGLAARYAPAREWVPQALDLVERFSNSEELHALVLVSTGRAGAESLPSEVGDRVRKSWSSFIERFPNSTILHPQKIGETDDEVLALLRSLLEPGAKAALEQGRAVEDGRAPLGLLATAAGRSYIETWLSGGTGTLFVYLPLRAITDSETAAAAAALDKQVVYDGSTLAILSLIPAVAEKIIPAFTRGLIPRSLQLDAVGAQESLAAPTAGLLGWDPEAGRPTMVTIPPEEQETRRRRAKWVEDLTLKLDVVEVPQFPDFPQADPAVWSWLASLQLAKSRGLALYCDDAWVRRLAASYGVSSFGTVDLLGVLATNGQVASADREAAIHTLILNRAVSVPLTRGELHKLAADEHWSGELAALQIAQSGFWSDPQASNRYEELLTLAAHHNFTALPQWLAAGVWGAGRNAAPENRGLIASRLLAAAIEHYGRPDIVPGLVEAARAAAKRVGSADPLPGAAPTLRDLMVGRLGHRGAILAIANLAARLAPDDSQVLKLPFFTPSTGAQ